jgi:hypothetical protein|tara:strand:- start:26 stop:214 length:189 start_codon:yes stop_codon:yes gene_type:complete
MAIMGKVTDVVDLPGGVAETKHQPATLVKFASGSHTFMTNDEYVKQKPYIDWYRREENIDGN